MWDAELELAEQAWRGTETVVDVGGGNGALLVELRKRRAGLRGIVFDLPRLVAEAAEQIAAAGLAHRCQTVAGSFFRDVPAGDVYVLSYILHAWDDDHHARRILGQSGGSPTTASCWSRSRSRRPTSPAVSR